MTEETIAVLDVREIIPRERHPLIFSRLDALDPKPLRYQLLAERPDMFDWEPEEQGPERWVVRIRKTAGE